MSRYSNLFKDLNRKQQGAFVPFVTIGDPSPEISLRIMHTLVESGADALELGIPFSDPLADGPTIQAANLRALSQNVTPDIAFQLIHQLRQQHPHIPIGLLVYANLVFSNGIENFYAKCQQAGVDSVLIADVPLHESAPFIAAAQKYTIAPIFICPPHAEASFIAQLKPYAQGYTYLLSRAGVTGSDTKATMPLPEVIHALTQQQLPPALLGFGISQPEHVKAALDAGAKGAISGSAIVKIIETYQHQPDELMLQLKSFVQKMKAATQQ